MFRYIHFVSLKHTEPTPMDLPVGAFVDTVEHKGHPRWQCVIVPSRSSGVSMHAADSSGKVEGMDGRGERKHVCGTVCTDRTCCRSKGGQLIQ